MTRRQTRFFFIAGTTIFTVIFVALTIHSHTRFAELTHEDAITADVIAGKHVWHRKNCINCHTMSAYAYQAIRRAGFAHPNTLAVHWTIGSALFSALGAGLLGLAHTWPTVNKWTHGTLITPMHGHSAFFGAYVMIVLAMISYAMPSLMGHPESQRESKIGLWAFWLQVGGMFGMTMAFAAAGIGQVYLERILGFGYLETQAKIQVHFLMLVGTGILFTAGVVLFLWDFFFLAPRQRVHSDAAAQAAPTPA